MVQIRCRSRHSRKDRKKGRKRASKLFREGRYLVPKLRHRLGDHRMISYELSYELRRGDKSLERKTEERQLAELDTV